MPVRAARSTSGTGMSPAPMDQYTYFLTVFSACISFSLTGISFMKEHQALVQALTRRARHFSADPASDSAHHTLHTTLNKTRASVNWFRIVLRVGFVNCVTSAQNTVKMRRLRRPAESRDHA